MVLRSIIVDDEFANRELLKMQIESSCKSIVVSDCAASIPEAVDMINKSNPDIVFLDVEMPGEDGFSLFQYFKHPDFLVVFVTAFEHYSIKAIQNKAFDYLLKPVDELELIKTEQRIITEFSSDKNIRGQQNLVKIGQLLQEIEHRRQLEEKKIYVPTRGGFRLIKINSIQYFEANGNYTVIKFKNGTNLLVTRTLGEFESELDRHSFYRCHKSFLINLDVLESYNHLDGSKCTTIYGDTIPVSRRKYSEFMEAVLSHVSSSQIK